MTATQSNLAGLSRFIFRAPSWYASLAFALLVAAMAGVAAFDTGAAERSWRGLLFLGRDAWEGIFFIGIPTIVASIGTAGVDRFLGGKLTPNRSSLLALAGEVLIVTILTVAGILAVFTPLDQTFVYDALVVALASVFAFRLLVIIAVSRSSLLVAAVPASLQTVVSAILLFVYSGTVRFLEVGGPLLDAYLHLISRADHAPSEISAVLPKHFYLLAITCVVYAVAVALFLYFIDRPWRQSLGVSMLDFLRGFIGHIAEGSRELEDFFEDLGQEAVVPVTVLSIRRTDGTEKARFVLPMIHPGPMGEIGGGNFPERVARQTDGLAFPPHATAGHDFNLVTEREVDTILDAADEAMDQIEYTPQATRSVRTRAGDAKMLGQQFGDDALLVSTYAPKFADDVEYAVGLSAAAEARSGDLDEVLLVDAHNSNDGLEGEDLGHVTPGSRRSFDMIEAAGAAGAALDDLDASDLSVGVAWDRTRWEPREGIGPLGIRVAVTEVDGQTTAYVLVDGNNMEPGLRGDVVDSLTGGDDPLVDVAEVMTTDTHVVNTVEADNQVGAALDVDEFRDCVERLVAEALDDREPATAGLASSQAEVTVFGNDRTETLASHANAVVSMGGALAGAVVLATMAVSVLIFLFA
jgi:putative membrane protein